MAEGPNWEELFRKATDANLRYVEGMGRVAGEYMRAWTEVYRAMGVAVPVDLGAFAFGGKEAGSREAAGSEEAAGAPGAAEAPALVMEGKGGAQVRAVFAVRNDTDQEVAAPVMSTGVGGPGGSVPVAADPVMVTVAPGDRALVTVGARVPPDLPIGEEWVGEVSVPGLSDVRMPVLLRRVDG